MGGVEGGDGRRLSPMELVELRGMRTEYGDGRGLAVWRDTLVTTFGHNVLDVSAIRATDILHLRSVRLDAVDPRIHIDGLTTGVLAFGSVLRPGAALPWLFVVDTHNDTVHVLDLDRVARVGLVCGWGDIPDARAVDAHADLVVVCDSQRVWLFREDPAGATWFKLRVFGRHEQPPRALRFTSNGAEVAVLSYSGVYVYSTANGFYLRCPVYTKRQGVIDFTEVPGKGWLVAADREVNMYESEACGGPDTRVSRVMGSWPPGHCPIWVPGSREGTLKWVPGLGLVVRHTMAPYGISVFSPPDVLRMRTMSAPRVAWMTVAVRARLWAQSRV